jgi:hypothetical protein
VTGPGGPSGDGSERVRIVVRPLATALPLGLFAFGIGMVLLGALEDVRQRRVLPVFRRGGASEALEGSLSEQLHRARREAGVRQQL